MIKTNLDFAQHFHCNRIMATNLGFFLAQTYIASLFKFPVESKKNPAISKIFVQNFSSLCALRCNFNHVLFKCQYSWITTSDL